MNTISHVDKLWFPVKLGPRLGFVPGRRIRAALAILGLTVSCGWGGVGCGYAPAYGAERPSGRLTVVSASPRGADSGALGPVLDGVRRELSRAGVLTSGTGYPRVVVELVRVDERTAGQAVWQNPTSIGGSEVVVGRGSVVGVTARAWILESPDARVIRDTGDVRRTATHASGSRPAIDHEQREAALVGAGRAAGEALGRRLLGEVEPSEEPM
jgi:hypothetical protein